MTAFQKLETRAIDVRKKLRDLATAEGDLDADKVQELRSELDAIETRQQALIAAGEGEPEPEADNPEGRELRSLIDGANLGHIYDAALGFGNVQGETRELQEHYGLSPNQVPLDLLRLEKRAVTPAPSNAGRTQAEILQPVFADGAAAFLGIPMPTVPVGDRTYPVLTTRPAVGGPHSDSTSVSETTGAFDANSLSPERIQASFFYRRTDAARFSSMDSALREALSSALMEKHDYEVLRGTFGLFSADDGSSSPVLSDNTTSSADSFQTYLSRLGFGRVDGRFAMTLTDLRLLVGTATLGHMGTQYNTPVYDSAANVLMNKLGGFRVSAHVPAVASDKQNAIVRLGMRRDAVSPIWQGVTIVNDEITKVDTGEIKITAIMMMNMRVLRAGGFVKIETKHA